MAYKSTVFENQTNMARVTVKLFACPNPIAVTGRKLYVYYAAWRRKIVGGFLAGLFSAASVFPKTLPLFASVIWVA
jgi:hypothetical protein